MSVDFTSTLTALKTRLEAQLSSSPSADQTAYLASAIAAAIGPGGINDIADAKATALTALTGQQATSVAALVAQQATSVAAVSAAGAAAQSGIKSRLCASLQSRKGSPNSNWIGNLWLMQDGTIRAAGYGWFNVGGNDSVNRPIPNQVGYMTNTLGVAGANVPPAMPFVKVIKGHVGCYAIDSAGRVWSWGNNGRGNLGHGDTVGRYRMKMIEFFYTNSIQIADVYAGQQIGNNAAVNDEVVYFRTTTGLLYAAGFNGNGAIGDGTTVDRSTPTRCGTITNVTDVCNLASTVGSVLALTSTGAVYAWGYNSSGHLGLGDTASRSTPTITMASGAAKISGGVDYYAAGTTWYGTCGILKTDGTVWFAGYNGAGAFGNGTTAGSNSWVQTTGITDATDIYVSGSGWGHSMLRRGAGGGEIWTTGQNGTGFIGDGTVTARTAFYKPVFAGQGLITDVLSIGAPNYDGATLGWAALDSSGKLWVCGWNTSGNLGAGTGATVLTPTQAPLPTLGLDTGGNPVTIVELGRGAVTTQQGTIFLRLSDGRVLTTLGSNSYGCTGHYPGALVSGDNWGYVTFI